MEILKTILITIGGTSVVILGLSGWLGKVWANRILEKDKHKYAIDLDRIKKDYEIHVEGLKAVLLRY